MRPVIVQKFGGTSVADAHRIHLAARRAVRAKLDGKQVVLVVSAMGKTTDHLVRLASEISRRPSKREMDMLLATGEQVSVALVAMAIHEAGYEAVSLTGSQVGMLTDSSHTAARIRSINTDRIRRELDAGRMVIVAGFQGVDPDFNITTLGRGGSDTTAVALAAALTAETCEIYTDVEGIYTADPRIVPKARKLAAISYDEMLELASLGAQVMHARAIELGMKYDVPIHVRSALADADGTMIMANPPELEDASIRGATLRRNVGRVSLRDVPADARVVADVFGELAKRQIPVDDIIQDASGAPGRLNLSFTIDAAALGEAHAIGELLAERHAVGGVECTDGLARVSVIGVGMRSHSGVAARVFAALAEVGVAAQNISTSEIVISAIVPEAEGDRALHAVHDALALPENPPA